MFSGGVGLWATAKRVAERQTEQRMLYRGGCMTIAPVPCPHCTRGTVTGTNGQRWRCTYCQGTGERPASVEEERQSEWLSPVDEDDES